MPPRRLKPPSSPDELENLDSWMMKYRKYAITSILANKLGGVYVSASTEQAGMAAVTYAYYSQTYGGGLDEAAFGDWAPMAEAHVKWLCAVNGACPTSVAYKRAVCAATDAFAEFGYGEVGGYTLGRFSVKNFENADGVPPAEARIKVARMAERIVAKIIPRSP